MRSVTCSSAGQTKPSAGSQISSRPRIRWRSAAIPFGRDTRCRSLSNVTMWLALVSSTVSCRRASEQTWIIPDVNLSRDSIRYIADKWPNATVLDGRISRDSFHKPLEQFEIALFCHGGGPWSEVLPFLSRRQRGRPSKETACLVVGEPGEPRRLEIGGGLVGRLDDPDHIARQRRRQAEAQVNGGEQALLDRLVGVPDHGLERRDHVTDDVFGRVVQEQRQAGAAVEAGRTQARDRLDQQRVLGDREDVVAAGLAVPARDPRQPVRDIGDLDIERGGVEQVEPPSRQHALPRALRPPPGWGGEFVESHAVLVA